MKSNPASSVKIDTELLSLLVNVVLIEIVTFLKLIYILLWEIHTSEFVFCFKFILILPMTFLSRCLKTATFFVMKRSSSSSWLSGSTLSIIFGEFTFSSLGRKLVNTIFTIIINLCRIINKNELSNLNQWLI